MPSKILLVDDDRDFRAELKECLPGYDIAEVSSGEEAVNILKKPNDIDLVILDVKLPGARGTKILKELKEIDPDIKIIMLTGYSSEDVAIESLRGRADEYIEKPVDVEKLRMVIEELLDSRSGRFSVTGIEGKVNKAKRFLERNYFKKVSLRHAASAVSLSPKYFSRVFKETTGKGFIEYRSEIRVMEAKSLLKNTGLNISQISDKTGYENIESFTRLFKSRTGLTPSGYRKRSSKKNKAKILRRRRRS